MTRHISGLISEPWEPLLETAASFEMMSYMQTLNAQFNRKLQTQPTTWGVAPKIACFDQKLMSFTILKNLLKSLKHLSTLSSSP